MDFNVLMDFFDPLGSKSIFIKSIHFATLIKDDCKVEDDSP